MNIKVVLCLCLLSMLIVGQVLAYEETIEYSEEILASQSLGWDGSSSPTDATLDTIWFPAIENYKYLYAFEWIETGTNEVSAPASHSGEFIAKYEATAEVVGSGYIQYITSEDNVHDRFYLIFTDWDIGTYTGSHYVTIEYTPTNCMPVKGAYSGGAYQWYGSQGGITSPVFGKHSSSFIPRSLHETIYDVRHKASINITNMGNFGGIYDVVDILFSRDVEGVSYPSTIDARVNDTLVFIDNVYATSGNTEAFVNWYPTELTVTFGYPTAVYMWEKTLYGDNPTYPDTPGVTPTPTITPTPTPTISVSNSGCGMNIELSLSKYANIFPYENITASLSIDDSSNLTSGSKITYVIDTFNLNSPLVIATFTNISGTWHAYKNDLGIFSDYDTTLSDALSENIRFSDAGYYTVSAYVDTPTGCYVYDTVSANVNPTSQVNVDFYFRDAISGNLVGFVAATIANVGITGNVSYYGNPIGIAASRYDNISIYCDHEGYETKFFYYTVPQPPYGNVLDVPVYLTPLEAPIIYADNTVLSVNVKSAESGEGLSNAYVSADILGVECDSGWTDGNGFVSLIVPFHSGYTLLSTGRFPYNSDSRYLSLNNATSYSVDVYLSYAGTPIVTPTPSYNYTPTLTPTTTDTPMPTSTVISTPLLYVHVWDADGGMSYPISSAIVTIYDGDEVDQTYKGAIMYTAYTDTAGNIEPLQIGSNSAFWASISKSGYYTQIQRYRMTTGTESHIYVPLKRIGGNVTVVTTQPTLVLPTPGGTGIQGGFIGWILDYFSEWFGVDNGTARILLALFIIMCSSVFVGGSLAGFGSGAGAGMGALIGGMFAFIAMCYVQFLPFWLLPIGIAFVGMAFFVWNRQEK